MSHTGKLMGKLAASAANHTNIVGSPIASVNKTGTPLIGAYSLSFQVNANGTLCQISSPGLAITRQQYVVVNAANTTLIPGMTITFGGTINNSDQALIVVTDQIQLAASTEGYLETQIQG